MFLVCTERQFGQGAKNAMDLLHVVHGKAWEDTANVFRQVKPIGSCAFITSAKTNSRAGPKSMLVLASRRILCE